jgi:type I restriction enzyme S subunit
MILAHTVPVALAGTELTINQDMKALKPKTSDINSLYLFSALKASHSRLLAQVGTAGHGTRKLDTSSLLELPILIPSPSTLKVFEASLSIGKQAIGRMNRIIPKLETLFQTLLHRAFSGDLTTEWRKAHMAKLLQEMEHQARVLGLEGGVE